MKTLLHVAAAGLVTLHAAGALAAVSADEARQLGTTLTAFGAEKAASADGVIPEYKGGLTSPPAGYSASSGKWPDPFKSEKPVASITAANMAQHADRLTPGVQALLKRFPEYRVDVYPTHRSMSYPQWVLDNTLKNATTAKLVGKVEGDGVEGAFGGVPFPIPKNGYEVMWNALLSYQRTQFSVTNFGGWLVDTSGGRTQLPVLNFVEYRPYYDPKNADSKQGYPYDRLWAQIQTPPTLAGQTALVNYSMNYSERDQESWAYFPAQRRVRMAPDYKYDTPAASYGGVEFWDEAGLFRGRMDRFDFKLIGKKEMIVPYNNYRLSQLSPDDVLGQKNVKPDAMRWERHRVWVVEATLKAGARHAYAKRVLYIDEDGWTFLETDGYGHDGKLWRVGLTHTFPFYEGGGMYTFQNNFYDLQKGNYFITGTTAENGQPLVRPSDKFDKGNLFTPAGMAGTGLR
ncbi:DUF1329 domain-containing protein [Paraburkholderia rhynchosiae]|uniref:DUF1329 domain-containing protein n=1 Tax=Paraburkholderia rhynchosiae TaxID=487049 RepID=A0A2N7W589_9BURK|nr:DUF1329 domain-containing protein [Paraburkholderia rhynchosiae]PMS24552.1 DUF1329 domain-containing protein [Paraburkholderia rhynchosiae]CAB3735073.1 hypothetical protein LMG27174_06173 [Paraburkholderia rhynchosiae]